MVTGTAGVSGTEFVSTDSDPQAVVMSAKRRTSPSRNDLVGGLSGRER